jgi:hypothetical protein
MTIMKPTPEVVASIAEHGFAVVRGPSLRFAGLGDAWSKLADDWMHLETDTYMADGGRYRLRRFGRFFFVPATEELLRLPHAPVFQSRYVNNFAGGIHRDFAPLRDATFRNPWLLALIRFDFGCFQVAEPAKLWDPWEVWIHQIRIRTDGETAVSPAPEGVHHDGHDFIAMHLVKRQNVSGGRSVLYDNLENEVHACVLKDPLDTIYADDHHVMHAVDPIRPTTKGLPAERDMLIIDFDYRPGLLRPKPHPD